VIRALLLAGLLLACAGVRPAPADTCPPFPQCARGGPWRATAQAEARRLRDHAPDFTRYALAGTLVDVLQDYSCDCYASACAMRSIAAGARSALPGTTPWDADAAALVAAIIEAQR
jgi:hypothetical protein